MVAMKLTFIKKSRCAYCSVSGGFEMTVRDLTAFSRKFGSSGDLDHTLYFKV